MIKYEKYGQKKVKMMSKYQVSSLPGANKKYQLHPNVKRYTLLDHGFTETKNGNFQYERALSKQAMDQSAPKMKLTVSKNFDRLRMSTVAASGMKKVNLYQGNQLEEAREMAEFYLGYLVENGVLTEV